MLTKSQGILLQEIPYLKGKILKVFTAEEGLSTFLSKNKSLNSFSPFCIAEWVYRKKQSEIFLLKEASLLDPLLHPRESYTALSAAGGMACDLLRTQLPAKSAPKLYSLLCSYFKKISYFERPTALAASFRLKLLLHEGLLSLQPLCAQCSQDALFLSRGESACPLHTKHPAIEFSIPEWQALHILTFARQFSDLQRFDYPPLLHAKIDALFEERIRND